MSTHDDDDQTHTATSEMALIARLRAQNQAYLTQVRDVEMKGSGDFGGLSESEVRTVSTPAAAMLDTDAAGAPPHDSAPLEHAGPDTCAPQKERTEGASPPAQTTKDLLRHAFTVQQPFEEMMAPKSSNLGQSTTPSTPVKLSRTPSDARPNRQGPLVSGTAGESYPSTEEGLPSPGGRAESSSATARPGASDVHRPLQWLEDPDAKVESTRVFGSKKKQTITDPPPVAAMRYSSPLPGLSHFEAYEGIDCVVLEPNKSITHSVRRGISHGAPFA
jgi:hypothetical protein